MEYDEERELVRYIWNHYQNLMTAFEQQVGSAILGRQKAAAAGGNLSQLLASHWGKLGDTEVEAALADGPEEYRRKVCCRVMSESSGAVFVNRCPRCGWVVRTPKARQCSWCGHDWHECQT